MAFCILFRSTDIHQLDRIGPDKLFKMIDIHILKDILGCCA